MSKIGTIELDLKITPFYVAKGKLQVCNAAGKCKIMEFGLFLMLEKSIQFMYMQEDICIETSKPLHASSTSV